MEKIKISSEKIVEAILFLENTPVTLNEIEKLSGIKKKEIREHIKKIQEKYKNIKSGLKLSEVSKGYMFTVIPELFEPLKEIYKEKIKKKLSRPALETLAIIAYKQPITRSEIEDIRGVDSGNNVKILLERNLVKIIGRKKVIGHPLQYGTTKEFLIHFSLKTIEELPTLKEIRELEIE